MFIPADGAVAAALRRACRILRHLAVHNERESRNLAVISPQRRESGE
jgi:hypothetical protein